MTIRFFRWLATAACSLAVLAGYVEAPAKTDVSLSEADQAVYDSLRHAVINPDRCFSVHPNSTWTTDIGEFRFGSGILAFFADVGGRPVGCFFRGKGRFVFTPPSTIEKHQLRRHCGDTILDAEMTEAYFRFVDTSIATGLRACTESEPVSPPRLKKKLRGHEKDAERDLSLDFGAQGWQILSDDGASPGWLYVAPRLKKQARLHFVIDGASEEAISLWRRPKGVISKGIVDLVCSYDSPRPEDGPFERTQYFQGGIDVLDYNSQVEIEGSGKMRLKVILSGRAHRPGLTTLRFIMAPHLEVAGLAIQGTEIPYIYNDDSGWLVARLPRPVAIGDTVRIQFEYSGDRLLDKLPWGDFYIHHTTRWLPRTALRQKATYLTTFTYPKHYEIVSVGESVSDTIIGDQRVSAWHTLGKVSYISFNYGSFEILTQSTRSGIDLRIYRGKNHLDGLFASDFKKRVATDIDGSIQLFQSILGPYPWKHLAVTEIPGGHGQGFPQMLHLSWDSFQRERKGVTDAFRAHEVAHQWFGHVVGWKTYHDQWLSEGFAEYAGALYVQVRYEGNVEFLNSLKRWRDQILQTGGRHLWHDGPDVAPIWLGFRCASHRSPASYMNLVYAKGAYVLHMLRQAMYNYNTDSESVFIAMMHDYIGRFSGQDASTEDFQAVVESHFDQPMEWFFDQWVYGTQIPRFEYGWEREQLPDGRWIARCTVDQFDTSPPFRVDMPITLITEDNRHTFMQQIDGAHTTFDLPPSKAKPETIVFNDFLTVLCRDKIVRKP